MTISSDHGFSPHQIDHFKKSGAWSDLVLWDFVDRWADKAPQALAVVDEGAEITIGEMRDRARRVAGGLLELGISRGDRVVVQLPNRIEAAIMYLGISCLGGIMVPQSAIYRETEVGHAITKTGAIALIVPSAHRRFDHAALAASLQRQCPSLRYVVTVGHDPKSGIGFDQLLSAPPYEGPRSAPGDAHVVLFTSGTTAKAKACVHTSNTLLFCALTLGRDAYRIQSDDAMFTPSPVTHTTGLTCGLAIPFMFGIPTVLQDVWDPEVALERITRFQCTLAVGATSFLVMLTDQFDERRHDLHRFRLFATGGAPVPSAVVERAAKRLGCKIMTQFGGTESQPTTFTRLEDSIERVASSDGRAAPNVAVAILDRGGNKVPPDVEGEICSLSPGRMVCYWDDDEATSEAIDSRGWIHTGDLGRMDNEGYIRVTGRTKDIIVRGGLNLSVREIEDLVLQHPRVADVAVVGMPDKRLGERVCAYIVTDDRQPLGLSELTELLIKFGVAKQKLPERLEIVKTLPRTLTGKVEKYKFREDIAAKTNNRQ